MRRAIGSTLAGAITTLCVAGHGRAGAKPRAVLLSDATTNPALVARIRGQASDLELELVPWRWQVSTSSDPTQQVAALAVELDAEAVLWIRSAEGRESSQQLTISVFHRRSGRRFVRRIGYTPASPQARSVALESAAVAVRTVLQALLAETRLPGPRSIGRAAGKPPEATQAVSPPDTPGHKAAAAPRVDAAAAKPNSPTAARPDPARAPDDGWRCAVGFQVAADGQLPVGQAGPMASVARRIGPVELSLVLGVSLPATLEEPLGRVELFRLTASAAAGPRLEWGHRFSITPRAHIGYGGFLRSTSATAPEIAATGDQLSSSLLLGADALARWHPPALAPLSLAVIAGFDYFPAAPVLRWSVAGIPRDARRLWRVQPRAAVALVLALR